MVVTEMFAFETLSLNAKARQHAVLPGQHNQSKACYQGVAKP